MKFLPLTTPRENKLRWFLALILPIFMLSALAISLRLTAKPIVSERPPALQLEYVVIDPVEEKKPEPPKRVKKPVPKKVTKPTPKKRAIAKVEKSIPTETPADIEAGDPEPVKEEPTPEPPKEPVHHAISSAEELDNTGFSPIYNPKPAYPVIARKRRITGYVDLDLTINEKGKITDFSIVKSYGHPTFGQETAKVISKWRFPPPRIKGKRVLVTYRYRVNFRLN